MSAGIGESVPRICRCPVRLPPRNEFFYFFLGMSPKFPALIIEVAWTNGTLRMEAWSRRRDP
jgi:hypothetical protein